MGASFRVSRLPMDADRAPAIVCTVRQKFTSFSLVSLRMARFRMCRAPPALLSAQLAGCFGMELRKSLKRDSPDIRGVPERRVFLLGGLNGENSRLDARSLAA